MGPSRYGEIQMFSIGLNRDQTVEIGAQNSDMTFL